MKGDLALAVADVESQQAAVQAEEEKALLQSIKQLPAQRPGHGRRPLPIGRAGRSRRGRERPWWERAGEREYSEQHHRRSDFDGHLRD